VPGQVLRRVREVNRRGRILSANVTSQRGGQNSRNKDCRTVGRNDECMLKKRGMERGGK